MLIAFLATQVTSAFGAFNPNVNFLIAIAPDTNFVPDSLGVDSIPQSAEQPEPKEPAINTKVHYFSQDSIQYDLQNEKVYLYGEATVEYEDISLQADYIELDLSNNTVYAAGLPDSNGVLQGKPRFKEGSKEYRAESMTYNYASEKGKINQAKTQEGDGYVQGKTIKKASKDVIFIKNGLYTTCSLDHPHFYIRASKLKIIQDDKIVTGPANMVIEDVQTPLALPFGFFPNQRGRQSGIVIPTYGNSPNRGYFLQNGGYYFGFSDHFDAKLIGDIYTNGSWAGRSIFNYNKRYKHTGRLKLDYVNGKDGDPEAADFTERNSFFVNWTHNQDPKARPNSDFRANVQAGSVDNFRNDFNTTPNNYLSNTFQSNISYRTGFGGTPFNLTLSASHNQNSNDSIINITLPQATFTMSRVKPFKKLWSAPASTSFQRNFRKSIKEIGVNYTLDFKNSVRRKQDDLFKEESLDKIQNGVRHSLPITTSIKAMKYFTLTPSVNYSNTMYFKTVRKQFNSADSTIITDTVAGLESFHEARFAASLTTKMYGMYRPKFSRIKAIRHVFTPSVSFNFTPDLSDPYYLTHVAVDAQTGDLIDERYAIFEGGIYGAPSSRRAGVVGIDLMNNLEMKYKSRSDTATELKKAKIFEALRFTTGYDIYKDSINWSAIAMSVRSSILNGKINFQANATMDPYAVNDQGNVIDKAQFDQSGDLARLVRAGGAVNFTLRSKRNESKRDAAPNGSEAELEEIRQHENGYMDFNIPWSFRFGYTANYRANWSEVGRTTTFNNAVTFGGDFNLTENWKVEYQSGYDFELNDFSFTRFSINRDLHCWQINFNVIPFGPRTSYTFDIAVKAPVLQDLKLQRKRSWFDLN